MPPHRLDKCLCRGARPTRPRADIHGSPALGADRPVNRSQERHRCHARRCERYPQPGRYQSDQRRELRRLLHDLRLEAGIEAATDSAVVGQTAHAA